MINPDTINPGMTPSDIGSISSAAIAGLPHLDIFTLSEVWALGEALHGVWQALGQSLGAPPGQWRDDEGRRIYAAAMALTITTDLVHPVAEDDALTWDSRLLAIRKPHALGETVFSVGGSPRMRVRLLTSLVRRDVPGSNKKLSKVRERWTAPDRDAALVNDWLDRHHTAKAARLFGPQVLRHEANRLADFNAADLFYFRGFAAVARSAEWQENRGQPPRLAASREAFFFGNVDDGEGMVARVQRDDDACRTEVFRDDGALIFTSDSTAPLVDIPVR